MPASANAGSALEHPETKGAGWAPAFEPGDGGIKIRMVLPDNQDTF